MENATKALLIAASVLIVIVLIAIGMRIVNAGQGAAEQSGAAMDATAMATFNNQFVSYLNKPLTANKCATLIQKMIASNATNSSHKVYWGSSGSTDPTTATATAGTYKAVYANGYITHIYKQ